MSAVETPVAPGPVRPATAWRDIVAPYTRPNLRRSVTQIATSLLPYLALSGLMYLALDVSYLLVLALAVPAAGFLVRIYILFHDCTHGSFLPSKRANTWFGRFFGLLVFSPFGAWKHNHWVHHATAGDLDRRGVGDVPTMTVAEYRTADRRKRFMYRLFRHPAIMFGVGPTVAMLILPRFTSRTERPRIRNSILLTDLAIVAMVTGLCLLIGPVDYLLIQAPTILMAGAAGVWLFYVQHQFEDVYWEKGDNWDFTDAALHGCSYLKLPKVLQFFSGNIGFHHVHHLSARIPNYNLQRAHDENPVFHDVPTLTLRDGLRVTGLKLWDEERGRLVTFAEAEAAP
jgi:acyl-lipid omega-6 desaturase (Delta-12 desaturase)